MNFDVQSYVLEALDFRDLLSIAQTNEFFSHLAQTIFKQKHSQKVIEIFVPHNNNDAQDIYATDDTIHVNSIQSIFRVFGRFGRLISKLKVRFIANRYGNFSMENQKVFSSIGDAISLYCSDSLTQLSIDSSYPHFFDEITTPFSHVEFLELNGRFAKLGSSTLNFTELFPKLRRLSLKYITILDQSNFNWTIPFLDDLHVNTCIYETLALNQTEIGEILECNPQIRSLSFNDVSQSFLITINKYLPHLENLQIGSTRRIYSRDFEDGRVIFQNIKSFLTYWEMQQWPDNIEFRNLTELSVHVSIEPEYNNWWLEFLDKNTHVKVFNVILGCLSDDDLKNLATKHLSLDEASLQLCRHVEDSSVLDFVQNNDKMKRIFFKKYEYMEVSLETKAQALVQRFSDKWKITNKSTDKIELIRRQHDTNERRY